MSRLPIAQLSFADLQLQRQGVHIDRNLQRLADFMEQHTGWSNSCARILQRGLKEPDAGRRGSTPEQTLRSLVLMRVKNWDYRDRRERNDSWAMEGLDAIGYTSSSLRFTG